MPIEIERKFLLDGDRWRDGTVGVDYRQGYLNNDKERIVRVRIMGEQGRLTIKGLNHGLSRREYEYDIPLEEARELLEELALRPIIHKCRYTRTHAGMKWEIDEFLDDNAGLLVAEVELESEDQEIDLPPWIGREISGDSRYFNSNLMNHPYGEWRESDER